MTRSWLFVPGDSDEKLTKSESVPADALILDLEDSVRPEYKSAARLQVSEFLSDHSKERKRPLWVRVNRLAQHELDADLESVMHGRPDGIVLPKAESPLEVSFLGKRLETRELALGIPPGATRIIPLTTETPRSLFTLANYTEGDPRLAGLTWGAEDLCAAIGAQSNREPDGSWSHPFQLARSLCLFAAHAAGVDAIDTVYTGIRDSVGLNVACQRARRDGFTGKLAIHPTQVEVINKAFTPSDEEFARAQQIVELYAAQPGAGVLDLDGTMLDLPHLIQARRIVAMANRWGSNSNG